MKKTAVSILLAAALALLAACGGGSPSGGTSPFASASTPPAVETPKPSDAGTLPETQAPAVTDDAGDSSDPILGVYSASANTYENEFIGIGCHLDAEWEVFDEAAIAELNGLMIDAMTDEALAAQMEDSGTFMPFYAQAEGGYVTLNITLENLGLLYGSMLEEKDYAELAAQQLPAALEAMGMSGITAEVTTAVFAGGQHAAISVSGTMQDVEFHELMICMKVNRYIANITAASYFTDVTGDVLDMFYAL